MAEINAGVRLSLRDHFSSGMKDAGQSVKDFGSTALGAVDKINKAFSGLAGTLATVGVTIGVGAAVKTYIDLDDKMVRIGTSIGATAKQTNELKRNLYAVATDPSIKMGTDSLITAMETFSSKSFDPEFIKDNLRDVGIAMKATGASGEEMANFFIESYKKGMNKEEIKKSLDDMSVIGDKLHNQFSLSSFTNALPGLEAVNSLLGKSAMSTTELFTAMNILGAGTKSPQRAVAAYTSIVNELADPRKQQALLRMGIKVRDSSGQFRNMSDILQEIAATDKGTGNFDNLTTIFSGAAMDAIQAYSKFGKLADGLEDLGDTTGVLEGKAKDNAKSISSNLKNLQTAFMGFADKQLTAPLEKLNEFMNKLSEDPERVERYFKIIKWGLVGIAGIKIGAGIVSFIANLKGIRGGNVNFSGMGGGGAGMPVHVTNWGGGAGISSGVSSMPGMNPSAGLGRGAPLGGPKINGAMLGKAGVAGGAMAAVVAIPQMIGELNEISANEDLTAKERNKAKGGAIGGAVGSIGGAAAGAIAGAAIGSVVPVVGTAIGALAGGLIGYFGGKGGRFIGEKIGEAVTKEDIPETLQNEIQSVPSIPNQAQTALLEGNASMDVNVNIHEDRTEASVSMRKNTIPIDWNTGGVWEARGVPS